MSEGGLVIRLARSEDAATIAALSDELNAGEGEPTGRFTADLVRKDGFGDRPEFRTLLAEAGGEALGYALFHPSYSTEHGQRGLFLYDLFVRPHARGRGIGRALIAALARLAAAEDRTFLWWCSKAGNRTAQGFYRRLGAVEEEVRAHALHGEAFALLAGSAPAPGRRGR